MSPTLHSSKYVLSIEMSEQSNYPVKTVIIVVIVLILLLVIIVLAIIGLCIYIRYKCNVN